jgi:hypothetical protein
MRSHVYTRTRRRDSHAHTFRSYADLAVLHQQDYKIDTVYYQGEFAAFRATLHSICGILDVHAMHASSDNGLRI